MGKINPKIYIYSGIITAMIFVLGVSIGFVLDEGRVSLIQSNLDDLKLEYENLRIQEDIYRTLNEDSCPLYRDRFVSLDQKASDLSEKFNSFTDINQFQQDKLSDLKNTYTLTNIDLWLQAVKLKTNCNYNITTVLYFYSIGDCEECIAQGIVLDDLKMENPKNLMIFAIDYNTKLNVVDLLKENFNITNVPYMIVDETESYDGFVNRANLSRILYS